MAAPVFKSDIPSEQWLQEKLEWTREDGRNKWGVPKTFGPITGSFDRPLNLPVELLASTPGERAEQSNVRPESLQYIRENFDRVIQDPVYVEVDPFGKSWISEGNHRIMVAAEKGVQSLPTQVRYFSGAEREASDFAPERLIALDLKAAHGLSDSHDGIAAQANQQSVVIVPHGEMLEFEKRLRSLNNKAERFGLSPIVASEPRIVQFVAKIEIDPQNGEWMTRTLRRVKKGEVLPPNAQVSRAYEIELEYPQVKMGNWNVIAQVEAMENSNLIFNVSRKPEDAEAVEKYRNCPIGCDHCETKRQRKLSYILKDATGDEYKQVGSTCLEDFTGIDPAAALFLAKMYEFTSLVDCSGEEEGRMGKASSFATRDFLTRVVFLTSKEGFVSASKAREEGGSATYEDATSLDKRLSDDSVLRMEYLQTYDQHAKTADAIRAWYASKETVESFDANVKTLLASDDILIDRKHLKLLEIAQAPQEPLVHVGTVGQKVATALTVDWVHAYDTAYGTQYRINLLDDDGNKLSWKTSTPPADLLGSTAKGQTFLAEFKIKSHDEYKEEPQTAVSHLKFKGWVQRHVAVLSIADTSTAAFEDIGRTQEAARIVREAAASIAQGWNGKAFDLRDTNGNQVGKFEAVEDRLAGELEDGEIRLTIAANMLLSEVMQSVADKLQTLSEGSEVFHDAKKNVIANLTVMPALPRSEQDFESTTHGRIQSMESECINHGL